MTDATRISYASTFLSRIDAVWWYTIVNTNQVPTTWDSFKAAVVDEFVPEDHVSRARDMLRKLKQVTSVSKYLSDFRNIALTIPEITDGEKWDKFCSGLKYEVRLVVLKSAVTTFEDAAKIALRVDSAIWGNKMQGSGSASSAETPTPMEIGNLERRRGSDTQRQEDMRNNACFKCHKAGCRPWKHAQKQPVANNVTAETDPGGSVAEEHNESSDSEN